MFEKISKKEVLSAIEQNNYGLLDEWIGTSTVKAKMVFNLQKSINTIYSIEGALSPSNSVINLNFSFNLANGLKLLQGAVNLTSYQPLPARGGATANEANDAIKAKDAALKIEEYFFSWGNIKKNFDATEMIIELYGFLPTVKVIVEERVFKNYLKERDLIIALPIPKKSTTYQLCFNNQIISLRINP